jgi:HAD superfamily hydrolase (TIGR01509 family)
VKSVRHIFFDDGGVINDNSRRAPQWAELYGEFFVSRLGATKSAWAEANRESVHDAIEIFLSRLDAWQEGISSYAEEAVLFDFEIVRGMFLRLGIPMASKEHLVALSQEATRWIHPQIRAEIPGASDAILRLAQKYNVFMASSGASFDLQLVLEPLGLLGVLRTLYGPDLVNFPKTGPDFYRRIFQDAQVEPSECLVVDDSLAVVEWAREAGAKTVLVSTNPSGEPDISITRLAELPSRLTSPLRNHGA